MSRNPFIPEPPKPDTFGAAIVIGGLLVAITLASSALAMSIKPELMPEALPNLVERFVFSEAGQDEPRCRTTDRIVRADDGELLRVTRFVACEADGDHDAFVHAERDVDCTLDEIGCLIALAETSRDTSAGETAVVAFATRGGLR